MTWTDQKGRRMRLWIPGETFVDDEEQFMETLVSRIESILNNEPVDIHVNPTYLPAVIAADYDRLWTPERMDRVIKALRDNDIALEINARFKIPSISFIKRAKAAGIKFTLGTNNGDSTDLNRLEYCIQAIHEAGITPGDIFLPRPQGDKKVLKKGLPSKITG
jgi:histidinol phosphatase-like PHP family hydrolase